MNSVENITDRFLSYVELLDVYYFVRRVARRPPINPVSFVTSNCSLTCVYSGLLTVGK